MSTSGARDFEEWRGMDERSGMFDEWSGMFGAERDVRRAERDVNKQSGIFDKQSGMSTSGAGCPQVERYNSNPSSFGLPLFCSNHSFQQQAKCNARIDRREI